MSNLNLTVNTPLLTIAEYAKRTGQTDRAVESQVINKTLPTVQNGARSKIFINMIELIKLCDKAEETKPVHQQVVWG